MDGDRVAQLHCLIGTQPQQYDIRIVRSAVERSVHDRGGTALQGRHPGEGLHGYPAHFQQRSHILPVQDVSGFNQAVGVLTHRAVAVIVRGGEESAGVGVHPENAGSGNRARSPVGSGLRQRTSEGRNPTFGRNRLLRKRYGDGGVVQSEQVGEPFGQISPVGGHANSLMSKGTV